MVTDFMRGNNNNSKNSYIYSDYLDGLLKDQLRFFELDNKSKKRIEAGENIPKDEKQELIRMKRNLDRRKVDILDNHIFRSMANLILFFDNLAEHPELRKLYEEDVKELLGFIGEDAKKYEDNIITRFLRSILTWDTIRKPIDFRLELMSSIQNVLYNNIINLTLMDNILGESVTNMIVNPDVGRALIWARMFSAKYRQSEKKRDDQQREPNRPIKF